MNGFPVQDIGKNISKKSEEVGFTIGPVCFS